MRDEIKTYYRADRIANAAFVGIALFFGLGAALMHWSIDSLMTYLFLVGTLVFVLGIMVVGIYRFVRSFKRYKDISSQDGMSLFIRDIELPRTVLSIEKVYRFRRIELYVIVASFFGIVICAVIGELNWVGTLSAACLMMAYVLAFDLFKQFRHMDYERRLKKILNGKSND